MLKTFSVPVGVLLISPFLFISCISAKKLDAHVAGQFNNQLPKLDTRTDSTISMTSSVHCDPKIISVSQKKSKSLVPLVVYWQYDYRHTCVLNPIIGIVNFRKTIYHQANKLKQKLNGQQLELTVQQIPGSFAIVDRGSILLFVIHWHKVYVEPDSKDLVVSYRVLQNGVESKSGKITVNNIEKNKTPRFAQSWKSSASEFLTQYNVDMAEMTKTVVSKLVMEL